MNGQPGWRTAMRISFFLNLKAMLLCIASGFLAAHSHAETSTAADKNVPLKIPVQIEQVEDSNAGKAAVTTAPICPPEPDPRDGAYEIGAFYGAMFPSGLIGSDQTLPTLGFVVGAPLWTHTLQAQVNYASTTTVRVTVLELNMRWNFESPYLASYFLTGAHYLKQSSDTASASDHGAFGLTTGLGLSFSVGTQLEAHFDLRGYIQGRTTILVGGGFSLLL